MRARALNRPVRMIRVLCVVMALSAGAVESRTTSFRVRQRTAQTVYLEGGSSSGLAVGDRLEVLRAGAKIGEVEVAFVAGFSASCSVISETGEIRSGDVAQLRVAEVRREMLAAVDEATSVSVNSMPQTAVPRYSSSTPPVRPATRISGLLSLDFETFSDDSGYDLGYDRSQARLSLRGRDLGGLPLSFRVRSRVQKVERSRQLSGGVPESESRDRLYEVALRYDAPSGRYSLMGGRLGAGPFISIGYLDGLLAEVRAYKLLSVGGFWGSRPDITELGFASTGQKYGGFARLSNQDSSGPQRFDVMLGGVTEEGDLDVSREYALLETYYDSGGIWSLFQRAEIDMNNDWREELSRNSSQLSNLALSVRARLSPSVRLSVSYDQFRQYRTEETRFIAEELFDDLLRQGVRVRLNVGQPRQLSWSLTAGWRGQEQAEDSSISFGLGARHPDVVAGISLSGDILGYSNLYSDGGVVRLRGSKVLSGGHEVYLDFGSRFDEAKLGAGSKTTDSWGRLGFWAELPMSLFARGEFEYAAGDSLEGTRVSLGLGYRF